MDNLERDYTSILLASREPPCLSLYQPTHRTHPDKQQDPIRFRNLVRNLELSLEQQYANREVGSLLAPFQDPAGDSSFWNTPLDGLAVFAAPDLFKVYRLQRTVPELAIVADTFHTKPLMRILQSADVYQILGLNREQAILYEGNRYALDEVELAREVPRTITDVVGEKEGEPEQKKRVYGPAGSGTTGHGTNVRQEERDAETERFFRAVDEAVMELHSRPSGIPLILAALPEHHHLFHKVSRNPLLVDEAIDVFPGSVSGDELRERAWQIMLPRYVERLAEIVERFGTERANGLGSDDPAEIAKAAAAARIATLLIEAERMIPGRFDPVNGGTEFMSPDETGGADLPDDVGEQTIRTGGEVIVVPAEQMPTNTGIAAIYRF